MDRDRRANDFSTWYQLPQPSESLRYTEKTTPLSLRLPFHLCSQQRQRQQRDDTSSLREPASCRLRFSLAASSHGSAHPPAVRFLATFPFPFPFPLPRFIHSFIGCMPLLSSPAPVTKFLPFSRVRLPPLQSFLCSAVKAEQPVTGLLDLSSE